MDPLPNRGGDTMPFFELRSRGGAIRRTVTHSTLARCRIRDVDNAKSFFDSLGTSADIEALVGVPEDLYFEAKTCTVPFSRDDKENLAEALSGFANADGGVLVYGLVARGGDKGKPDAVERIQPVSDLTAAHSLVLGLLGQVVEPQVEGACSVRLPMAREPKIGFLVVYVPRDDAYLHRSRMDREFYRRHGYGFYKMEHYEIAEFYGRRKSPELRFWWGVSVPSSEGRQPNRVFNVRIVVGIRNNGRGIAKHPAMRVPRSLGHPYGLDGSGRTGLPAIPAPVRGGRLFAGGDAVIYPGTELEITTLPEQIRVSEADPQCGDFEGEYELYAEDAVTAIDKFHIKGTEILEKLRDAILP